MTYTASHHLIYNPTMADLLDIYKLITIVNKQAKQLEGEDTSIIGKPNVRGVKEELESKLKSKRRAQIVYGLATSSEYLTVHKDNQDGVSIQVVHIEAKGWELLEKTVWVFPKGLWLAWSNKNKSSSLIAIGFVGGIVIGGIPAIVSIITLFNN